jgi:hypothetical protein
MDDLEEERQREDAGEDDWVNKNKNCQNCKKDNVKVTLY